MDSHHIEKIEILPVTLLDQNRPVVEDLRRLAKDLKIGLGWHYLLDLSWIITQLGAIKGQQILDAGAGSGVMQWYLARHGAEVLSVDRTSRAGLSLRYRTRYRVSGLRSEDLLPPTRVWWNNIKSASRPSSKLSSFVKGGAGVALIYLAGKSAGKVSIYNQDLSNLAHIRANSLDAVVAVSSLEHNSPENLPGVVNELMRVLKKGGVLLATLGASRDQDWFHKPSQGWCYTADSLKSLFNLSAGVSTNYQQYDQYMAELRNCTELREKLASFYFKDGDNGMPWGKWEPQYQPVGVCKIKE